MRGNKGRKRRNRKRVSNSDFSFESSEKESVSSAFEEKEDDEESERFWSSEDDRSSTDETPSWGRGAPRTPKKTVNTESSAKPSLGLATSTGSQGRSEAEFDYSSFRDPSGARFTPTDNNFVGSTNYVNHNSLFSPFLPPRFLGVSRVCLRQKRSEEGSSSPNVQEEEAQYLKAIQSWFEPIIPHFNWDETLTGMSL